MNSYVSLGRFLRFAELANDRYSLKIDGLIRNAHNNLKQTHSWFPPLMIRLDECVRHSRNRGNPEFQKQFDAIVWDLDVKTLADAPQVLGAAEGLQLCLGHLGKRSAES